MNKPITIIYEEFKQQLADLINNSGLPILMIEPILQNYLNEVRAVIKKQYETDKRAYEASLSVLDCNDELEK